MLRLEGITKRFGPVVANRGITLEVGRGEVLALLGENGAGKTTLVSLLYGLYAPDEGRILLEGQEVRIPSPREAQRLGIALVPQHPELIQAHTVAENLALGLDLPPFFSRPRLLERLKGLLQDHPLKVDLEAPIARLSAGEKQRVELLRALLSRPKVLILDEPTSVLTPKEAEDLFQEVRRLKALGLAVIFISHKLEEVLSIADRIAVLRAGEKVGEVPREEADRDLLVRLMVGRSVAPPARVPPPREEVVLEVQNLLVPRHGFPVQGVSFTLRAGEVLGIAGVAGSGQTELLEALAGQRPYRGEVRYLGEPLPRDPARLYPLGVAHIPEERAAGVVGGMSVAENLALRTYPAYARRGLLDYRAMEQDAERLIAQYGIKTPSPKTPVRFLSGGNVQKVILARELRHRPKLLLAMHPTYGVDVGAAEEVHGRILDLVRQGAAVLLVSEDLDEILSLSHRVAALYHGRLVGPIPREEADRERLGRMMTEGRA
ncbi:ABC transporter ATP-binding protein [Thermus sp.]|uniref:ABC transporter ATP-binding protein n=1 Tax=Thermus sp. TaxID=275 RepID=UPI0025E8E293|nr:ABC transporter ATP-binding protein [Thermus sp.]MCS6869314.1 ABC transporter ATP-binding protein [Thermus sp.]MDW8358414.1 ABC transporter ATP-binding protein [Thermus sp.]